MYCGDGINDLIALAAADVGVAIGASDASAAATISTQQCSVAGTHCRTTTSHQQDALELPLSVWYQKDQLLLCSWLGLYHPLSVTDISMHPTCYLAHAACNQQPAFPQP